MWLVRYIVCFLSLVCAGSSPGVVSHFLWIEKGSKVLDIPHEREQSVHGNGRFRETNALTRSYSNPEVYIYVCWLEALLVELL